MPQINQLPLLNNVSSGDQIPVYTPNNGDARRLPVGQLLDFFQKTFASPEIATNIYTPGTGFNIAIGTPIVSSQWVVLQPASTLASGAITLPMNTSTPDGTEVLFNTTQQITEFSLILNGASNGYGFPATLRAEDFFRLRFYAGTNSWYRIA